MAQEIYHRSEWGNPNEQWGNVYLNADLTNELYKRASEYENSWVTDQLLNGVGTKPSIILTPTAYEDGVLNSVKPAKTFGSELVTNGTFDDGTNNWGGTATLSIDGGRLKLDGIAGQTADQTITAIVGKKYQVSYDLALGTATSGALIITGGNYPTLDASEGTNTFISTATSTSFKVRPRLGTNGTMFIDNVSVKEVTEADFQFSRNSSATRVNELGLVQDVQLLSGELVQNGNFEQIGSELVTNGSFDTDSDWTKLNATISDGKGNLNGDGQTSLLYQNILTQDKFYKVTFTVSDYNELGTAVIINNNGATIYTITSNGTFTIYFKHTISNGNFLFRATNGAIYSIDNVSVKEVGQNWTFGTGWSMGDGVAVFDTTSNSSFITNLNISSGNLYRLKIEGEVTSGNIKLSATSGLGNGQAISLPFEQEITHDGGANTVEIRTIGSAEGFISNVSVVEITDDTDLPRINYTNFDYENGEVVPYSGEGSLLLEPQSTNLVTYSEDFSEWSLGQGGTGSTVVISNNAISPDGNNTADKVVLDMNGGTTSSDFSFITISYTSSVATYILSCYLKGVNGGEEIFFDLDNGNNNLITLTNEWVRYDFTKTVSTTGTRSIRIGLRGGSTTDDTASFYIYGAMLEQNSFTTSYIPTNGSTVTRLADVCNNSGNSDLINSTEGVLYAEVSALANDGTVRYLSLTDGTSNNRVLILYYSSANNIRTIITSGGTNYMDKNYGVTSVLDFHKVAIRWKANDFSLWVDGSERKTDTSGSVPIGLNSLSFDSGTGSSNFYGNVKCVAVFKEALSDTELQKLTTI